MNKKCVESNAYTLLNNLVNPVHILNLQDFTVWRNKASQVVFGKRKSKSEHGNCFAIVYGKSKICNNCHIMEFVESNELVIEIEKEISKQTFKVTCSKVFNDKGEIVAVMQEFSNITKHIEKEIQDELTQILNRRGISNALDSELSRCMRDPKYGFSAIFIDLDNLKEINDKDGHLRGDKALIDLAMVLRSKCRKSDIIGRWGGDEFIVIAPNTTNSKPIKKMSEKIRKSIEEIGLSVSIGAGTYLHKKEEGIENFIQRLDKALYSSKQAGKNMATMLS